MKVICVGSGPGGVDIINRADTSNVKIVGVNNVWRGTDKWDYLIYAGDYPFKKDIVAKPTQQLVTVTGPMNYKESYIAGANNLPWEKARIHCGLPIYFTITYWALHYLNPSEIAFAGFDMDYTPQADGATTFYGVGYDIQTRGVPDPLYQFRNNPEYKRMALKGIDVYSLLITRLRGAGQAKRCKFFNLSDNPKTMLPWDHKSIEEFLK